MSPYRARPCTLGSNRVELTSVAAAPDRPIVAVTGDSGVGQYLAELTTAVAHRMPIRHVLLDNSGAGPRASRYVTPTPTPTWWSRWSFESVTVTGVDHHGGS